MAATIGLVQNDIKKVYAYSTVSQLGYMFVAMGVGAYGVGIFHLFTHAFFKALLFLGAGSVIHAMHHEQDMRNYGNLRGKVPFTFAMMMIGTLNVIYGNGNQIFQTPTSVVINYEMVHDTRIIPLDGLHVSRRQASRYIKTARDRKLLT